MAVGWVLRKVMGKRDEPPRPPDPVETQTGPENPHYCCQKSTWRWIVTLVLSLQLLVFVIFSLPLHGHRPGGKLIPVVEAPIMFMFRLERSASVIKSYKSELESNLSKHLFKHEHVHPKVSVSSVKQIANTSYTEVRFQLIPDRANSSEPHEDIMKDLRKSLVKLFLKESSLSLTPTKFGRVIDFQINKLPGSLTIPDKSSLSRRSVLFNFTLCNRSISTVTNNLQHFKKQLIVGLWLQSNEVLITRLTNLNGSTVEVPVIVQVSIFRDKGGRHLPRPRLKQLAHRLNKHWRNLGLNHTIFGKVRAVQLSPVLQQFLERRHPSPTPSPSPEPNPNPDPCPDKKGFYGYSSPKWYPSVYLAPAPAPELPIETGFAKDDDLGPPGISSVPAQSPKSSDASLQRVYREIVVVLMALGIILVV